MHALCDKGTSVCTEVKLKAAAFSISLIKVNSALAALPSYHWENFNPAVVVPTDVLLYGTLKLFPEFQQSPTGYHSPLHLLHRWSVRVSTDGLRHGYGTACHRIVAE